MPRISIYVTDALKTRMDAAGEAVNWSAKAQQAFDDQLKQVEGRSSEMDEYEAAVERLRNLSW